MVLSAGDSTPEGWWRHNVKGTCSLRDSLGMSHALPGILNCNHTFLFYRQGYVAVADLELTT